LYDDTDFRQKITRSEFEELTTKYAARVAGPVTEALSSAHMTMDDIDSVILHGGAARTPFVQKALEAVVGSAEKIRSNVNADEAAVFGAAFKGAGLSKSFIVKDIRATDNSGYAVGLKWTSEGKDRSQKIFVPQSATGAEKQVPFKNQDDFDFKLYQHLPIGEVHFATITTDNLTASVAKLTEKFGCEEADIKTNFAIRLSPVNGLPEVVEGVVSCEVEVTEKKGGVVEDVKGFFGFGQKKGEQEPLHNDEESESSSSSATSTEDQTSSTSSAKETETAKASTEEPNVKNMKTESITVGFASRKEGYPELPAAELKRIKDR
jgi:hypoxia up-regulated 1